MSQQASGQQPGSLSQHLTIDGWRMTNDQCRGMTMPSLAPNGTLMSAWTASEGTERSTGLLSLEGLLAWRLVVPEDWEALTPASRAELKACSDPMALLDLLGRMSLLTDYQVARLRSGKAFGLVLGNYR